MKHQQIDVPYLADLARIDLSNEECILFESQLNDVLGYIEKLYQADIEGVEPTAHASPVFDAMREDIASQNLHQEDLLKNAPESREGKVCVPKVVDA